MALFGVFGTIVLLSIVISYLLTKLTKWAISLDDDERKLQTISRSYSAVIRIYYVSITVIVLVEFWPGLASWASTAVNAIPV